MISNDIFVRAFENLRAGVLLLEKATGRVMEANPAFLRMCGRPRSGVVGRSFWARPLIDDAEAGGEVFEHWRAGGRVEGAELPLETGDGGRLLLEVSGGELADGVVQLEVQDATARAGARMAERMDAQRLLATRMAGEFTEMGRTLQAASEMLANCARRGQSTFLESDEIRKAADRAGVVVRELLAYSGQVALETSQVPLNELIEDMQPALQQMLGRDIQLVPDLENDVAPVLADPAQVRQIVLKLAANSREAMEHGGKVRVGTRNAPADDPAPGRKGERPALQQMLGRDIQLVPDLSRDVAPVLADPAQVRQIVLKLAANSREAMEHGGKFRVGTRNAPADDPAPGRKSESGSYAVLEIGDQGPGLGDESGEHLYEPFFTTKQQGKPGLGLAAVHGIVRQLGGRLWAHSEPGKGASFRIYLPRAQTESVALPAEHEHRRGRTPP